MVTEPETAKKLAIFDIDGTVFRSAVMFEIAERMVQRGMLSESAYAAVLEAKDAWKNRRGPFEAYNERFIKLMEHDFKGVEVGPFEELAAEVIGELKDHQYRYTRHLMADLRDRGYLLMAVSGTLRNVLDIYNRYLGFDRIFAGELAVKDGRFLDRVATESPYYGKDKVVNRFLADNPEYSLDESYGVGDTESDLGFLELVANPIAFNPNKKLLEHAREKGWEVVVERKDVIYHLTEPSHLKTE